MLPSIAARGLSLSLSLSIALVLVACGAEALPVDTAHDERSSDRQALPVDQGLHGDTQALPVDQGATPASTAPGSCASDADCVAAQCCHATSCTLRTSAPNCADAMCTRDCRGGTLDCGGGCYCDQGRCAARLAAPVGSADPGPSGS